MGYVLNAHARSRGRASAMILFARHNQSSSTSRRNDVLNTKYISCCLLNMSSTIYTRRHESYSRHDRIENRLVLANSLFHECECARLCACTCNATCVLWSRRDEREREGPGRPCASLCWLCFCGIVIDNRSKCYI